MSIETRSSVPLTDIQARLLAALRQRAEQGEPPPSYRELCADFGWSSTGTVRDHLRALARKGYVELPRSPGGRVRLRDVPRFRSVPVVGRIAAGAPRLAEEDVEGRIPIPADWAGRGDCFALRVTGDSMKDAGILEGDQVVVRQGTVAASGDIVAATIDGETTLKRFIRRGKRAFLVPENTAYEAIEVKSESATIHGTVVALLRSYRSERAARSPS
ncbi:MAG TPA: transcriptional repressor LexA [Thermoanaerobaculia bacterium]|nr:transcriptional repressor LexA [Thermoanaerobaculia bacterium]